MAKAQKKSAKDLQDDTVMYSLNPDLLVKGKSQTAISTEEAAEYLNKVIKTLPPGPI